MGKRIPSYQNIRVRSGHTKLSVAGFFNVHVIDCLLACICLLGRRSCRLVLCQMLDYCSKILSQSNDKGEKKRYNNNTMGKEHETGNWAICAKCFIFCHVPRGLGVCSTCFDTKLNLYFSCHGYYTLFVKYINSITALSKNVKLV